MLGEHSAQSVPIQTPIVQPITLHPNRNKSSIMVEAPLYERRGFIAPHIAKEVYTRHNPKDGQVANARVNMIDDRDHRLDSVKKSLGHLYNHATPLAAIHTKQANFHWSQPNHNSRPDPYEMQNHRSQQYNREAAHAIAVVPASKSRSSAQTNTMRPRHYERSDEHNFSANKTSIVRSHIDPDVDFTKTKNSTLPARSLNGGIASGGRLNKSTTRDENKIVFAHSGLGSISNHPSKMNEVSVSSNLNKLVKDQTGYNDTNVEIALPLLNLRDRPRPLLSIAESAAILL